MARVTKEPVRLRYPFRGHWRARNSPARRVPSHGSHLMGTTYAIDFVPVDDRGRSAVWNWRALVGTEAPETFVGFGVEILAPCPGTVVIAHDGEPDHEARRSPLRLIPYMVTQGSRARQGPAGVAGNHVVIAMGPTGPYVLLAHLQRGSVDVRVGDRVGVGDVVGLCGNSGNSTQPHVHVQVSDTTDWARATGLPLAFDHPGAPELPGESEVVTV